MFSTKGLGAWILPWRKTLVNSRWASSSASSWDRFSSSRSKLSIITEQKEMNGIPSDKNAHRAIGLSISIITLCGDVWNKRAMMEKMEQFGWQSNLFVQRFKFTVRSKMVLMWLLLSPTLSFVRTVICIPFYLIVAIHLWKKEPINWNW